jgi:RNA polymerase sigma factor (sigma-70 family)
VLEARQPGLTDLVAAGLAVLREIFLRGPVRFWGVRGSLCFFFRRPCKAAASRRVYACMVVPNELARLRPRLLAFALRTGASREQAEDAVQDTLVAALEGLDRYAGMASLHTWLAGILKHKLVDGLRALRHDEPIEAHSEVLCDPAPGPEAESAGRRALAGLDRALGRLPRRAAQVFVLREVLGMEVPEVCAKLSITPANCWIMLHRARARLRLAPEIAARPAT